MRLFLVRHGQTDANLLRKSQVGKDPALNATGVRECERCSRFIDTRLNGQQIDAVFCSTLLRATQTAELLLRGRPEPIVYEESSSLAEGCYIHSMKAYTREIFDIAQKEGYKNVLIVSHSSVIKYMVRWLAQDGLLEVPHHTALRTPKNASLSEISVDENGRAALTLYNALSEQ